MYLLLIVDLPVMYGPAWRDSRAGKEDLSGLE
jgi:hypothetical protein